MMPDATATWASMRRKVLRAIFSALPLPGRRLSPKLSRAKLARMSMCARCVAGEDAAQLAGLTAFLGHLFPVWLKFRGGKGIATYIGVLIGLFLPAAAMFGLIWIATAFTTRYSSLSALVACFVTPIFLWFFGYYDLASLFAVMTLISFWTHRENIKRLQAGTEGKIGQK